MENTEKTIIPALPEKFCENMKTILGDEYDDYVASFSRPQNTALRINPFKEWCGFDYTDFNLRKVSWCQNGFYYENPNAGKTIQHDSGLYYIQDASAMAVVDLMDIRPHEKVLDLCASPGGKSTQIAERLQNTGLLVSNEIVPTRAKTLSSNIERMGITNALVLNESVEKISDTLPTFFDKVLVDAPCSGEGMFRKNHEAIIEWEKTDIVSCAERQYDILDKASKCVKGGGILTYSTCTFNLEENEKVIAKFCTLHPDFEIIKPDSAKIFSNGFDIRKIDNKCNIDTTKCIRLFPHKLECEGHFICVMKRKEIGNIEYKNIKSNIGNKVRDIVKKWCKQNNIIIDNDNMYQINDNIYILPEYSIDVKKVRFLRYGLHVGQILKDRFEPSHSLALAIKNPQNTYIITNENELKNYLHGDILYSDNISNGWVIICYQNIPIGWGKNVNGTIKNYYPKGLRK